MLLRPEPASRFPKKTILVVLGSLMLAVAAFSVYRGISNGIPTRCTKPGQHAFLEEGPALADVVAEGERCLALIRNFGKDRDELLGAAAEYFRRSAKDAHPTGALRHGELYDPSELSPGRLRQHSPDPRLAFEDYQNARRLGSKAAEERLEAMRPYLEKRASEGDEDALSILGSWPQ